MKITVKGYLHIQQYDFEREPHYQLFYAQLPDDANRFYLSEHEWEVDVPDTFDFTTRKIGALRDEVARIRAEATAKVNNIEEQIQRLLAIEYKPQEAA